MVAISGFINILCKHIPIYHDGYLSYTIQILQFAQQSISFEIVPNIYQSLSIGPQINGLEDLWRYREQPDITCRVNYYHNENVTFVWELVRRNGDVIIIQSHVKPTVSHWLNAATTISALNYTMSNEDFRGILRCTAQVDDKANGIYKAKGEESIPCCGMCYDPERQ